MRKCDCNGGLPFHGCTGQGEHEVKLESNVDGKLFVEVLHYCDSCLEALKEHLKMCKEIEAAVAESWCAQCGKIGPCDCPIPIGTGNPGDACSEGCGYCGRCV